MIWVRVLHVQAISQLLRSAWLCRLVDRAAVRCIHLSRRDPRESAETEQALFDQLAAVLDTAVGQEPIEMVLQTPHWYQHLKFAPVELSALCSPVSAARPQSEMQRFLADIATLGSVGAVLLTASAARLPGLAAAVDELILHADTEPTSEEENVDFGEDLVEDNVLSARVHVLDDDAVACAAFDLALRQQRRDLPRGHLDCASLPGSSADAAGDRGPARLYHRGEDHLLSAPLFALGRDPSCHLIFDNELYPTVSARHCEIVLTRGADMLARPQPTRHAYQRLPGDAADDPTFGRLDSSRSRWSPVAFPGPGQRSTSADNRIRPSPDVRKDFPCASAIAFH